MRENDDLFHTISLEATAMSIVLGCGRLRKIQKPLPVPDRERFAAAAAFVKSALSGERIRRERRLSATPSADLLAFNYARETLPAKLANGKLVESLRQLQVVLEGVAKTGQLQPTGPWDLDSVDSLWRSIFWLAASVTSRPTDQNVRPPVNAPALL